MTILVKLVMNCDLPCCTQLLSKVGATGRHELEKKANDLGWFWYHQSHFCPSCKDEAKKRLGLVNESPEG